MNQRTAQNLHTATKL